MSIIKGIAGVGWVRWVRGFESRNAAADRSTAVVDGLDTPPRSCQRSHDPAMHNLLQRQACPVCEGRKFIPIAWTATDNPWFNRQPDIIRLKDGQVLLGKVAATVGSEVILRLRDGKTMRVNQADVLSKP